MFAYATAIIYLATSFAKPSCKENNSELRHTAKRHRCPLSDIWQKLKKSLFKWKTWKECWLSPVFWSFNRDGSSDSIGECEESNCVSDSWQHNTSDHWSQSEWISENEWDGRTDVCSLADPQILLTFEKLELLICKINSTNWPWSTFLSRGPHAKVCIFEIYTFWDWDHFPSQSLGVLLYHSFISNLQIDWCKERNRKVLEN